MQTISPRDKDLLRGQPVSGVFQDYVEPLLVDWVKMNPRPSYRSLNKMCRVPCLVWNATVYSDYYLNAIDENPLDMIFEITSSEYEKGCIEFWIRRKRTEFKEFRYLFGEFKFYERNGENRCRAEAKLPPKKT